MVVLGFKTFSETNINRKLTITYMLKQRFLLGLFAASFILIFASFPVSMSLAGTFSAISAALLAAALIRFVYTNKRKKIRGIVLEEVVFTHNFLFRTFFKPKDFWVVYDNKEKKFRPADFREMPKEVGLFFLIGVFLLYTSYLMSSNIFEVTELLFIRAPILLIIAVLGIYTFFVSVGRTAALINNKNKEVAKLLNRNRTLKAFIKRENAYVEVTPSFTLRGFVTSVEFDTKKRFDTKKTEKLIVDISRELSRYK